MGKTFHILEKDFIWYQTITAALQSKKPHSGGFSFLKGSILALCKERRVYRTVGSMKFKLQAKRVGAEWYKICTKGYLVLYNCVSVSQKEELFNGKAFRKKKVSGRHFRAKYAGRYH
jgi:hypothetical protein